MIYLKKWLNIAIVAIMLMTLVTPAVGAENLSDTASKEVVESSLLNADESNTTKIDENTQQVISLIDAIPSIEQLNETSHLLVQDARAAYEKLTDEQKQRVTNLQTLVKKENALQALAENVVTLQEVNEPAGYVYFSMEDFAVRGEGAIFFEQLGIIIDKEKVPFYTGDTIADVTVRALEEKGITPIYGGSTKGEFYLSAINNFTHNGKEIKSFGEFSAGNMSGWMVSLNDWFINMGASEFLVTEGDTIAWQYTGDYGADIGSNWMDASAEITGLQIVENVGQLSPAFDPEVKSYTLTVPKETKVIQLKGESNKMSRIQYFVGNVEYKMATGISINNGTVITIKSTFEDTMSGTTDTDEITIKVVFEKDATDKTLLQKAITDAEANKATVAVSTDGKDIDPENFWITQVVLDTYVDAITAAQELIVDESATQEVVDAKTLALNQATTAFNDAKKAGLKKELPKQDVEFTIAPKTLSFELYDEAGQLVDIGKGTAGTYKVYTAKIAAGNYQYEGFDANGKSVGSGQLTITDEPQQKKQFRQLNFKATNTGWTVGTDYTIKVGQDSSDDKSLKLGDVTSGGQIPVLGLAGKTFFYTFEPAAKYNESSTLNKSITVTIGTSAQTISAEIPFSGNVSFTVPQEAQLFVGRKIKHFISFEEIKPQGEAIVNPIGTKTYSYKLAKNEQYNYRVSQAGKLTNTGIFTANQQNAALEITKEQLDILSPKAILNKDTYLEGNIYLNINPQNYLSLNEGESFKLLPLRSWQALIEGIQNYFFEPDFHYEIITGNDVVEIEPGKPGSYATVKALKNGTAIVKVTYDALKVNGSTYIKDANDAFSAIWPENVGLFVVTVGQGDVNISTGIESNKERNVKANEKSIKNLQNGAFDADIDSVYFVEGERGAYYTFTPEENSEVTILRPQLNKKLGTASYGDGSFTTDDVRKNEDGSFTILLTEGRNIVKVAKNGKAAYQVMTARPISVTIDNLTNPGEPIVAGNKVKVKVDGISFPSNKLSGIYNFNGQLTFTDSNNNKVTGKAVQYNLVTQGNELTFTIPEKHVGKFVLQDGHIAIKGFGSAIGAHRDIDPLVGANPNFTAVSMESYYSAFPQITIISGQTEKADTAALQSIITDAEANKTTVTVSTDGKDIDPVNFWVTQAELDTYVAAITAAQELIADESATQEAVDAKTLALNQATTAFNAAKKAGLKTAEQLTTEQAYNTSAQYLLKLTPNPQFGSEWIILALARGGYEVPTGYYDTYYNNVVNYVQSVNGELNARKYTEYSRLILALTAIGKDPRNVGGYNIVEKLYNFDNVVWQGLNGAFFGLIALDTWGFELPESATTTRQKLIDHILSKQLTDGGFALSGTTADPDMTAMAIQALTPYGNESNVKAAIDRAVTALATIQKANGGYASWGSEAAESVAQVITALVSLNLDPMKDERFDKIITNLLSFYSETDGGFKHVLSQTKADGMATEQASYTLAAYKRLLNGQTALYNMLDTKQSAPTPGETEQPKPVETEQPKPGETEQPKSDKASSYVTFSIIISSSEVPLSPISTEVFEGESVFDVLKRVTSKNGIPLSYRTTGYGIYIDGINGLYEFDRGPESGWMYRVNGVFPSYSAALHTLQPGDRVEWLYTTNLGKDVGGYINDIEKGSGQTENNSNKGNEQDKATQLESNKADNKNQEDKKVIEVESTEGTIESTFTAEDIKQYAQNNIKTFVIQDTDGTKLEIPSSALSSIRLTADEKIVTAMTAQDKGKQIEVSLSIKAADGSTKAFSTGKAYAKVTLPITDVTENTVVLQSINGEYKPVPHKIVDGEIIILTKTGGTFVVIEETVTFKDIAQTFNKDEIEFLANRHVIKGVNGNEFEPNKPITRAQFAAMISRALGLHPAGENTFSDTKGQWYEQDVQALFDAGITTGKTVDTFAPEAHITRQEAAAFMARVLAYVNFQAKALTTESNFNDVNAISAEFKQYIELLNSLNIMTGKTDSTFDPNSSLTRAQMAKILKRTLNIADLM